MNVAQLEKSPKQDDDSGKEERESNSEEESFADMVEGANQSIQENKGTYNPEKLQCKSCLRSIKKESLVRHLTNRHNKNCRAVYGEEFIENWKRQISKESKKNYKEKNQEAIQIQNSEYFSQYYEANKEKIKKKTGKRKLVEKERKQKKTEEFWRNLPRTQKEELERRRRYDNFKCKEGAEQHLEEAIQVFQENKEFHIIDNHFVPKFTGVKNVIEETYKKLEKEIDLVAEKAEELLPDLIADKNKFEKFSFSPMFKEVSIYCRWHAANVQIDNMQEMKLIANKLEALNKYKGTPVCSRYMCDDGWKYGGGYICSTCKSLHEPKGGSTSTIMTKEKEYIRKRKPMNITVADLEKSMDEDDEEFKANVGPIARRTMPRQKTEKEKVMEDLEYLKQSESESDNSPKEDSEESESESEQDLI